METLANLFFILILLCIAFRTLDWLGEIFDDIFSWLFDLIYDLVEKNKEKINC